MKTIFPLAILLSFLFCSVSGGHGFGNFGSPEYELVKEIFQQTPVFSLPSLLLLIVITGQLALSVATVSGNDQKTTRLTYTGLLILNLIAIPLIILSVSYGPANLLSYIPFLIISISYLLWRKYRQV